MDFLTNSTDLYSNNMAAPKLIKMIESRFKNFCQSGLSLENWSHRGREQNLGFFYS